MRLRMLFQSLLG